MNSLTCGVLLKRLRCASSCHLGPGTTGKRRKFCRILLVQDSRELRRPIVMIAIEIEKWNEWKINRCCSFSFLFHSRFIKHVPTFWNGVGPRRGCDTERCRRSFVEVTRRSALMPSTNTATGTHVLKTKDFRTRDEGTWTWIHLSIR